MKRVDRERTPVPSLPPLRRPFHPTAASARRNDLLRQGVLAALRGSRRYSVVTNMRVPVTEAARRAVRRADRLYVGASLPIEGRCDTVVIDMSSSMRATPGPAPTRSAAPARSRRLRRAGSRRTAAKT
jgi:hypothetical protein